MKNLLELGECVPLMRSLPDASVDLGIIDPPYNIGFDYGEDGHQDNLPPEQYFRECVGWMSEIHRLLKPTGSFWIVIGDEWVADLRVLARKTGLQLRSWVIWYYTFGSYSPKKLTRSHAHLLYLTKHKTKFTFNEDSVRIPSARALEYDDKRANPDGRLPDDTWFIRPVDVPSGFPPDFDLWHIPRVCGTFKERQDGAANQLPEQLVARIIRLCSNEGDVVLDPMAGTFTVPAVAKKLGRDFVAYEKIERFFNMGQARVAGVSVGDPIDLPVKPTKGRKRGTKSKPSR